MISNLSGMHALFEKLREETDVPSGMDVGF